ncbi:MAG: redoxin domain-containing protein [Lacipirellulaceae bacterium]
MRTKPYAAWLTYLLGMVGLVGVVASVATAAGATPDALFSLRDTYGELRSPSDHPEAKGTVVAFLGVECPLARLYGPRLQQLADEFAGQGVTFYGIDANAQDSLTELASYGRRHGITFPLLKDERASAADALGATRTPEVVLLGPDGGVRYRGRIDDQYGVGTAKKAPDVDFLRDALEEVLAGTPVGTPETDAVGCVIGRPRKADESAASTYYGQVAHVFERHCVECHRDGEIAPFALRGYDEAAGWAETIAEVVRDQRMPPWHADPKHGEFANARRMTADEKQQVYDWVAAGAPAGNKRDAPTPRVFTSGWRLPRDPDLVVPMRGEPYRVAAEGVIDYQYFAVDPGFTEDRWVQAADIVPGDRSVLHHVIVFVSPPADKPQRGLGWLTAYVPGQSAMQLPAGQARLVSAGSKLIFQMHYTPSGVESVDQTKLGLVFADPATVTEEVVSLVSSNAKFEIPPGAGDHRVSSSLDWFPPGSRLLAIAPHMHFRGKSARFTGRWADGRSEVLLDVPRYDFNWQTNYVLKDVMEVETGFRIDCEVAFDNSAKNPANPDPNAAVRWGDQSFEEMMVSFFEVAVPRGSLEPGDDRRELSAADVAKASEKARAFFARYDGDNDRELKRNELPDALALFAFNRYDTNGDKRLTEDEVRDVAIADASSRL